MTTKLSKVPGLLVAVGLVCSPLLAAAADGEKVEVSAEGTGKDKKAACDDAKKRAMRDAVEQKAGVYLAADTLAKDSMLVHDKILTRADGFVSGVKVLDEKASPVSGSSDFQCAVKISATVEKSKLADEAKKIAAAFSARGRPKVLLLVAEQSVGMSQPVGWWSKDGAAGAGVGLKTTDIRQVEAKIISEWQKNGWVFVDPDVVAGKLAVMGPVGLNPTDKQIREIGKLSAAEVVVFGHAVAEEPQATSGMAEGLMGAMGKISVRAVATDSGEIYASYNTTKGGGGFTPASASAKALDTVATMAAKELERKIIDRWVSEAYGTMRIALVVKGVKDYATLAKFKSQLSSGVSIVKELNQRNFEGGQASFDVECEASADKLADALAVASFQDYAIQINKVTGNTLDVTLAPASGGGKRVPGNR